MKTYSQKILNQKIEENFNNNLFFPSFPEGCLGNSGGIFIENLNQKLNQKENEKEKENLNENFYVEIINKINLNKEAKKKQNKKKLKKQKSIENLELKFTKYFQLLQNGKNSNPKNQINKMEEMEIKSTKNQKGILNGMMDFPGILECIGFVEKEDNVYLFYNHHKNNLQTTLQFSPSFLNNYTFKLFVMYQILRSISHLHENGWAHGCLSPSNFIFTFEQECFIKMSLFTSIKMDPNFVEIHNSMTQRWSFGEITNFEYIMYINQCCGKHTNDPYNFPILPWVTNFSQNPLNLIEIFEEAEKDPEKHKDLPSLQTEMNKVFRNLQYSKIRLAKGDQMLDFLYKTNGYHISENSSDLSYFIYKARRTPIYLLRNFVRKEYNPNEFPISMERLYNWSSEECIPEFFTDPSIFISIHSDMQSLKIPDWTSSYEEFCKIHMQILESDFVSLNIHEWINLNFGYKLSGDAAISAKNLVKLNQKSMASCGFVQLFQHPHPRRIKGRNGNFLVDIFEKYTQKIQEMEEMKKMKESQKNQEMQKMQEFQKNQDMQFKLNSQSQNSKSDSFLPRIHLKKSKRKRKKDKKFSKSSAQVNIFDSLNSEMSIQRIISNSISTSYSSISTPKVRFKNITPKTFDPDLEFSDPEDLIESNINDLNSKEFPTNMQMNFSPNLVFYQKSPIGDDGNDENEAFETKKSRDYFALGCIFAELFIGQPFLTHFTRYSYKERTQLIEKLPHKIYRIISFLLNFSNEETNLEDIIENPKNFPIHFKWMINFISNVHDIGDLSGQLTYIHDHMSNILELSQECRKIIVPVLLKFFDFKQTTLIEEYKMVNIFRVLMEIVGKGHTQKKILPMLRFLIQGTRDAQALKEFLSPDFAEEIRYYFGNTIFFHEFIPLVITGFYSQKTDIIECTCNFLLDISLQMDLFLLLKFIVKPMLKLVEERKCVQAVNLLNQIIGKNLDHKVFIAQTYKYLLELIKRENFFQNANSEYKLENFLEISSKIGYQLEASFLIDLIQNRYFDNLLSLLSKQIVYSNDSTLKKLCNHFLTIGSKIGVEATIQFLFPTLDILFSFFVVIWSPYVESYNSINLNLNENENENLDLNNGNEDENLENENLDNENLDNENQKYIIQENYSNQENYLVNQNNLIDDFEIQNENELTSFKKLPITENRETYKNQFTHELAYNIVSMLRSYISHELLEEKLSYYDFMEKFLDTHHFMKSLRLALETFPTPNEKQEKHKKQERTGFTSGFSDDEEVKDSLACIPESVLQTGLDNWEIQGEIKDTIKAHATVIRSIDCDENSICFVTGSKDGSAKIWKLGQKSPIQTISCGHSIQKAIYTKANSNVAVCDYRIRLFDIETGAKTQDFSFESAKQSLTFSYLQNHESIASLTNQNTIALFDIRADRQSLEWLLPTKISSQYHSIDSDHIGSWFISVGSKDGDVITYDSRMGVILDFWKAEVAKLTNVLFAHDNISNVLLSSSRRSINSWDISSQNVEKIFGSSFPLKIDFLPFDDDINCFTSFNNHLFIGSSQFLHVRSFKLNSRQKVNSSPYYSKKIDEIGQTSSINIFKTHKSILIGNKEGNLFVCV
ncbi:hypothetical protein M0811_11543 [Anaeramoeba ignava]|uniref:BEACH domain-containing protein n=1 Tax=Anaeramoeba ignava TaxID=1746090 RepID=A0A9Q0R7U0_ANAIG|nr:hypothetical protein M0811_11543 [Anaeramoeba ignava]